MPTAKLAIDPLWQCLCPSWTQASFPRASRLLSQRKRPVVRCVNSGTPTLAQRRPNSTQTEASTYERSAYEPQRDESGTGYRNEGKPKRPAASFAAKNEARMLHQQKVQRTEALLKEPTPYLYTRLRALAIGGKVQECWELAEYIVKGRREKPTVALYSALILSNISHDQGAAWRVTEYLEEMRAAGLQPDPGTCHAVLKVLGVHPDHLLRADILEYMKMRWFQLSEDGAHDVAAGLMREALFEQGMHRMDAMQRSGIQVQPWLLDLSVYMLCMAGEVEEAYRVMRQRNDAGELQLSRGIWYALLDAGSSHQHHPSTSLIWNSQVNPGYLNPPSGVCFNVLTTAARAGDAVLATEVFSHLSKRGTAFSPIHYQLLIDCYLCASPPDLKRALSIVSIMALEKMADPSPAETRSLYIYLRDKPALVSEAFSTLRDLHSQGRKIPIAALNLIIECYVEQKNLAEALKVYKLIHTFVPATEGAKKTFANIETFNLLLRGCRTANPPDEGLASFLVSELLALRVKPTALTYDRLILVFVQAGAHAVSRSQSADADPAEAQQQRDKGLELLDWAFRHFTDMQAVSTSDASDGTLGWMPRFGTLERLAVQLAKVGDSRCWDVLQAGEDHRLDVEGWEAKGKWVRKNVEEGWEQATGQSNAVSPADVAHEELLGQSEGAVAASA